jgi:hypothetical protein
VTKQSVTQKLVFPFLEVSRLKEEMDIDDQDGGTVDTLLTHTPSVDASGYGL